MFGPCPAADVCGRALDLPRKPHGDSMTSSYQRPQSRLCQSLPKINRSANVYQLVTTNWKYIRKLDLDSELNEEAPRLRLHTRDLAAATLDAATPRASTPCLAIFKEPRCKARISIQRCIVRVFGFLASRFVLLT